MQQWNDALWAHNHYRTKSFSLGDHVFWFPKTCKEHTCKFKQCWFGPYRIQYCLLNNITFLVTVNKFDPNPILVNINKLKPYQFSDKITSWKIESIVKRGRDIANNEIGFNIATLENAQGTCTKFSFLVDGTKIQESWLETKIQDSVVGIKIQDPPAQTKNLEDPTGIEICTIGSKIENLLPTRNSCPRTEFRKLDWTTNFFYLGSFYELAEIVELGNINQILDPVYPIANSYAVELVINVVHGELMDESRTRLLESIGTFCLLIELK
jgi:hypothetical protein